MVDAEHQKEVIAGGTFRLASSCIEDASDASPFSQVELALHLDSMTALLKLMYVAPRMSTIIPCVSWLSLNMVRIPLPAFVVQIPDVI